jgi:hypothetical protein
MFFGLGNKNPHPAWGGNYKKLWIAGNKNPHHFGWGLKSSEIKIWRA